MGSPLQHLLQLPRRVLSLLVHGSGRIEQLTIDTRRVSKLATESARTTTEIGKRVRKLDGEVGSITKDMRELTSELREIRSELKDRLLQYNLQLGRLSRIAANGHDESPSNGDQGSAPRLSGRAVAAEIDDEDAPGWDTIGHGPHPDPEGREWLVLDACPMCGHAGKTIVNEWNKLILLRKAPDLTSARYDFAVCHACGISYATRRPTGSRYKFLNQNFGEVTAKHGGDGSFKNPLLNPYPLTDGDRAVLRRRAAPGVYVSEHRGLKSGDYLEGLIKDRFENSAHLDLLGALLNPRGARVLEIRPRTGTISEGLRRLYGAEVLAMPIWESQELLLKEVYGITSLGLVNYDDFDIPSEGPFDLIICNHLLTHAVQPPRFFAALHRTLAPGGHVYFYNEPDDAEYLEGNQSMLATLNPLHMQAFDLASFDRGLAANGLDVVFHKRRNKSHLCLAKQAQVAWTPMSGDERERRIRAYRAARDRAILVLRDDVRARFAEEWPQIVERSVAEGIADYDAKGQLRLVAR